MNELEKLRAENEKLIEGLGIANKYVNKYHQTLQEIKAIAENREIFCENCSFCCDEFTCDDCGYVKILQKIARTENSINE